MKDYAISSDDLIHDKERLRELQALPLERKIQITQTRITEWYYHFKNEVYVSFSGGKDSTVLVDLTARICKAFNWKLTLVFVDTGLEYPEIRQFVKDFKVWLEDTYKIEMELVTLRPKMKFNEVVKTHGYPILTKIHSTTLRKIRTQNLSELYKNKLLYGDDRGNFGKLPEKFHSLINAPFKISEKCCDELKKKPYKLYEKKTGKHGIVGTMATESELRKKEWLKTGCNSFNVKNPKSVPLSFWTEQDVLQYLKDFHIPYCKVYGNIQFDYNRLILSGEQRTGCMFCMFGCHLEKEPNRFQRMKQTHPKQYEYCIRDTKVYDRVTGDEVCFKNDIEMNKFLDDGDNEEFYRVEKGLGCGKVLDYIGVKY